MLVQDTRPLNSLAPPHQFQNRKKTLKRARTMGLTEAEKALSVRHINGSSQSGESGDEASQQRRLFDFRKSRGKLEQEDAADDAVSVEESRPRRRRKLARASSLGPDSARYQDSRVGKSPIRAFVEPAARRSSVVATPVAETTPSETGEKKREDVNPEHSSEKASIQAEDPRTHGSAPADNTLASDIQTRPNQVNDQHIGAEQAQDEGVTAAVHLEATASQVSPSKLAPSSASALPPPPVLPAADMSQHDDLTMGIDFEDGSWSSPEEEDISKDHHFTEARDAADVDLDADDNDEDEFGDQSYLEELDDADLDAEALATQRIQTPEIRVDARSNHANQVVYAASSSDGATSAHMGQGTGTGKGKERDSLEESEQQGQDATLHDRSRAVSSLPGLSTASGFALAKPSEAALAKARAMMSDAVPPPSSSSSSHHESAHGSQDVSKGKMLPPLFLPSQVEGETSMVRGFQTASGRSLPPPSAAALRLAEARFAAIEGECEEEFMQQKEEQPKARMQQPGTQAGSPQAPPAQSKPTRAAPLAAAAGPSSFSPVIKAASQLPKRSAPSPSPSASKKQVTPFAREPIIDFAQASASSSASKTHSSPLKNAAHFPPPSHSTPLRPVAIAIQSTPQGSASRSLGSRAVRSTGGTPLGRRPKFKTPFKSSADRVAALRGTTTAGSPVPPAAPVSPGTQYGRNPAAGTNPTQAPAPSSAHIKSVFDLKTFRPRLRLHEYNINLEELNSAEATRAGCPIECLVILNDPEKAKDFEFHVPCAAASQTFGYSEALTALKKSGATLIDIRWVCNHWTLILWKLAAFCRHQPHESATKWSSEEAVRQLKYR